MKIHCRSVRNVMNILRGWTHIFMYSNVKKTKNKYLWLIFQIRVITTIKTSKCLQRKKKEKSIVFFFIKLNNVIMNKTHVHLPQALCNLGRFSSMVLSFVLRPKTLKMIWLSNLSTLIVPDAVYSRKALCALN